jgi:hypothetical protein
MALGAMVVARLAPTAKPLRLCKRYCNSMRAAGVAGPLCPACEHHDRLFAFWERVCDAGAARK